MRRWWWPQRSRPCAMSVLPPWDQGMSWCAWQRAGGRSQSWAVQPASRMAIAMRWAAVWKRRLRPMSRTSDLPPRTAGMMPGRAGEPAGLGRTDLTAGVEGAHAGSVEVGAELLEGHRDHDGGRAAAGLGQGLGRDGLQELAEREAVAHRRGQIVVDVSDVDLAGEHRARTNLPRIWPCRVGMRNWPWQVPSSSSRISRGAAQRGCFLGLEGLAVVLLGEVGSDHFEEVPPEHGQGLGVVVGGKADQVLSACWRCSTPSANSPVVGSFRGPSRSPWPGRCWLGRRPGPRRGPAVPRGPC